VNNLLPEEVTSSEDIDEIFAILDKEKIEIVDPEEEKDLKEEALEEEKEEVHKHEAEAEEMPRMAVMEDPVRMYLKQMGQISLLTREQELELAKKIKEAELRFRESVFECKFCRKEILALVNDILARQVNIDEVIDIDPTDKIEKVIRKIQSLPSGFAGPRGHQPCPAPDGFQVLDLSGRGYLQYDEAPGHGAGGIDRDTRAAGQDHQGRKSAGQAAQRKETQGPSGFWRAPSQGKGPFGLCQEKGEAIRERAEETCGSQPEARCFYRKEIHEQGPVIP
jgi:hypothetical protein